MTKSSLVYTCSNCDAQFPKWMGRCEQCGAWGSVSREAVSAAQTSETDMIGSSAVPVKIHRFMDLTTGTGGMTIPTNCQALDDVLGGGVTPGSVTLIAGEPGMGKSTLLTQAALVLAQTRKPVLYVAGEESATQIQLRLKRLAEKIPETLSYIEVTKTDEIVATIEQEKPALVIVDSIQSVSTHQASGESGSISQVKASAALLTQCAKKTGVPLLIVGQVTKDGDIAGPRVLEHVVDTVLSFEGDRLHRFRILRVIKHRFGSTDETVLLDMTERGLQLVEDPSAAVIGAREASVAGSAIGCVLEGRRPLIVELQALVTPAGYSTPTRRATGYDASRLNMLLAVLTRHAGLKVYDKDVFANVAGGFPVRDPAADLALAAAIASAVQNKPLDKKTAYMAEIGLTGELRPIPLPELRIKELKRMGFDTIVCPPLKKTSASGILMCKTIQEALDSF